MPSPFPGMNPFFEQPDGWSQFHNDVLMTVGRMLEQQLGDRFFVKVDQNIYGHEPGERSVELVGRGDVFVGRSPTSNPPSGVSVKAAARSSNRVFMSEELEEEEAYLEIRDVKTREVLTVIDLLSPTNKKPGPKRDQFLAKRRRILASNSHYIEVDLLRGFPRLPWRNLPTCDYYIVLSRVEERPSAEIWPLRLRDSIPIVPVPLRDPHPDIRMDFQAALNLAYDAGGYWKFIYDSEPEPPLSTEDQVWADSLRKRS